MDVQTPLESTAAFMISIQPLNVAFSMKETALVSADIFIPFSEWSMDV